MIAQIVALVSGAPELTRDWIDCLADAVSDARRIDLDELAVRRVLEHVGTVEFPGMSVWVIDIGARAN